MFAPKSIASKENGNLTEDAIKLIAKTSEGSVRDSISLLDRALISQSINDKRAIEDQDVREMLGLADKSKIISLFKEVLTGNEKEALKHLSDLINNGLDAKNFLNDILEVLYLFSRRINLGPLEKDMSISEAETAMIEEYSKNIEMIDIGLFWQLTIKTIDDLKIIVNENLTIEMYIMQLIHLKKIDERKKELIDSSISYNNQKFSSEKKIEENTTSKTENNVTNQLKSTNQIKSKPLKDFSRNEEKANIKVTSFQDLIDLANKEREIELKYDLERNVKLIRFNKGKIDISFNEKLNKSFIKNLTEKLLQWTGERWIISLSMNSDVKSLYEKDLELKSKELQEFKKSTLAKDLETAFPDARLVEIKKNEE